MRQPLVLAAALAALSLACGERKPSPPAPPPPQPAAAPAPAGAPAPSPAPAPSAEPARPAEPPSAPATPAVAPKPTPTPAPAAVPAPAPTPAPAVAPAPADHARVGPEKCKGCHKVQYDSWATSAHKAKGLDCEGCHGNGADYRSASVMRNRAAAVAAGLLLPGPERCRKCHPKADASLLPKAHLHKVK